jgi:PiT family inorganic phosphate transporter
MGGFHVPGWVVIGCYVAMGLGTLSGGWKIIETMGSRITKLSHHQGFCASMGGSLLLFGATAFGIPVSTTHTITGCIMGVGAAKRASAVRWGVAQADCGLGGHHSGSSPGGAAFYWVAVAIDRMV